MQVIYEAATEHGNQKRMIVRDGRCHGSERTPLSPELVHWSKR